MLYGGLIMLYGSLIMLYGSLIMLYGSLIMLYSQLIAIEQNQSLPQLKYEYALLKSKINVGQNGSMSMIYLSFEGKFAGRTNSI